MKKLLIVLIALAFGCQSGQENEINELKEEVMALHDDVMPKMSELNYTKKNLLVLVDSLKSTDSTQAAIYYQAAQNITSANSGMREWMQNYNPNFDGSYDEVMEYLNEKKVSIEQVKKDMEGSLLKGRDLLEGK